MIPLGLQDFFALRIWKGYREAQCAWASLSSIGAVHGQPSVDGQAYVHGQTPIRSSDNTSDNTSQNGRDYTHDQGHARAEGQGQGAAGRGGGYTPNPKP